MKIAIESSLAAEQKKTGLGIYVDSLLRGLSELYGDTEDTFFLLHHEREWHGSNYGTNFIPVSYRCGKSGLAAILFRLNSILKRIGADVFHAPGTTGIPPFISIPSVATIHDIFPLTLPGFPLKQRLIMRFLLGITLKNASAIAFNSQATRKSVEQYAKRDFSTSAILYPGSQFEFYAGREQQKKQPGKRPYMLYVGAIEPRKGQVDFCKGYLAALQATPELPDLVFVGPNRGDGKQLQEMLHAGQGKIRHLEYADTDELFNLYQNASLFVFFSKQEGFGMPLLEAMTLQLPILCSDLPVFHEICGDRVHYCDRSTEAIQEALLKWQDIPKTLFSAEDYQKFSWLTTAKATYEIYKKVKKK